MYTPLFKAIDGPLRAAYDVRGKIIRGTIIIISNCLTVVNYLSSYPLDNKKSSTKRTPSSV